MFGTDPPGDDIKVDLRTLLEGKLSDMALSVLCSYLQRHRRLKLTQADMAFMRPPGVPPSTSVTFHIPRGISPNLFTGCLSQNLEAYLNPLRLSSPTGWLRFDRRCVVVVNYA